MAKIIIDNQEYEVKDGQNLLQAALSQGLDLPYFCWHPALGSVGACRQCAVRQFRDANDTRGKIVMACMTPAVNGARISIDDQEARDFRVSIIEWLMLSHPHDCPVCDEGGECHLQDMTVMAGQVYRRFAGKKRTFRNQNLGPLVNHEMNRCIQCYRCVRFYRDYAGAHDFDVFGSRNHVYFGRRKEGTLESEFSGNLVEICPTGVFTDKILREHYTRKWDLQTAPSVCVHCGLGCNTITGARYGTLRRVYNRYNGEVNGYFLCDRGRYGYEFVDGDSRLRQPLVRAIRGDTATAVGKEEALGFTATALKGGSKVIGIGSPRASLEANFALRTLVGADRFYAGVAEDEDRLMRATLDIMQKGPRPSSLSEVGRADAAFVLAEDVTQTAPMLALALRQSVRQAPLKKAAKMGIPAWDDAGGRHTIQQDRGPLFIAASQETRLDDVATRTYRASPAEIARLGFAVAHAIDVESPAVPNLPPSVEAAAAEIAAALVAADEPVVVSGSGSGSEEVLRAAANVARALRRKGRPAQLCLTALECNSLGLALMSGGSLKDAFEAMRSGKVEAVVILENGLYRRADAALVDAFLHSAKQVILVDHTAGPTAAKADVILPAATFADSDGTLVNNEGRAQRFYKVIPPSGEVQESWRWLRDLMVAAGRSEVAGWRSFDNVVAALAKKLPLFAPVAEVAPTAGFRIVGQPVARQSSRSSGRTAMNANLSVHEPQSPQDVDSPLSFSMDGFQGQPPSALIPRYWSPGWNSVQSLNKFQEEIGGPLRGGDPGRRLIEPQGSEKLTYYTDIPGPVESAAGDFLLVPAHHIFGSEELSALAPGIAGLTPQPYVGVSTADAQCLSLKEGKPAEVSSGNWSRRLPVKIIDSLPAGTASLPVGLPGVDWLKLPARGELRKEAKA